MVDPRRLPPCLMCRLATDPERRPRDNSFLALTSWDRSPYRNSLACQPVDGYGWLPPSGRIAGAASQACRDRRSLREAVACPCPFAIGAVDAGAPPVGLDPPIERGSRRHRCSGEGRATRADSRQQGGAGCPVHPSRRCRPLVRPRSHAPAMPACPIEMTVWWCSGRATPGARCGNAHGVTNSGAGILWLPAREAVPFSMGCGALHRPC